MKASKPVNCTAQSAALRCSVARSVVSAAPGLRCAAQSFASAAKAAAAESSTSPLQLTKAAAALRKDPHGGVVAQSAAQTAVAIAPPSGLVHQHDVAIAPPPGLVRQHAIAIAPPPGLVRQHDVAIAPPPGLVCQHDVAKVDRVQQPRPNLYMQSYRT